MKFNESMNLLPFVICCIFVKYSFKINLTLFEYNANKFELNLKLFLLNILIEYNKNFQKSQEYMFIISITYMDKSELAVKTRITV